jgi:hypothetical protein
VNGAVVELVTGQYNRVPGHLELVKTPLVAAMQFFDLIKNVKD